MFIELIDNANVAIDCVKKWIDQGTKLCEKYIAKQEVTFLMAIESFLHG